MIPNQTYSSLEVAKLFSAGTSVLTGFALTVIILLLERVANQADSSRYDSRLGKSAITFFTVVLVTSMLSSFLYTLVAGEVVNGPRAYLLFTLPAFVYGVTTILLFVGLTQVIGAYKLAHAVSIINIISYTMIATIVSQYSFTLFLAIAVMSNLPLQAVMSEPFLGSMLTILPIVTLITGYLLRRKWFKVDSTHLDGRNLQIFLLVGIFACVGASSLSLPILTSPLDVSIPAWQVMLLDVVLALFGGWAMLYIPYGKWNDLS